MFTLDHLHHTTATGCLPAFPQSGCGRTFQYPSLQQASSKKRNSDTTMERNRHTVYKQTPSTFLSFSFECSCMFHMKLEFVSIGRWHGPHVVVGDKVDCHTLSAKSPTPTNAMEIVLHVCLATRTRTHSTLPSR